MNYLSDIITYVRRIIKSPSNATISDSLIIDYINRFYIMDMSARIQLFDLKTKYKFITTPGWDQYNMPLYSVQVQGDQPSIASYPVYQGFINAKIIGMNANWYTQEAQFYNLWPNYVQQNVNAAYGNGTNGPYTVTLPFFPAIPGHVDITGIMATGSTQDPPIGNTINTNIPITSILPQVYFTTTAADGTNAIVCDSGQFLMGNVNYGLLMQPGGAPNGNLPLQNGYSTTMNTINYATGTATFYFNEVIPDGMPIIAQGLYIEQGLPRSILFYNNTLTLRSPPSTQYEIELDCYLTPAAFLSSAQAVPFGYMSEYIARGAARKILSDTLDKEQFMFYEPLFIEQENLVHIRSQRQWTNTRTQTIYSGGGSGITNVIGQSAGQT